MMNNEMSTKEAKDLGRKAFVAGKMRVPGWEKNLPKTVPMMTAWLKGWDSACVEGMMSDLN